MRVGVGVGVGVMPTQNHGGVYKGQGRNQHVWRSESRHSRYKEYICNIRSPSRCILKRLPDLSEQGHKLLEYICVVRVQPRAYKSIINLVLPQTSLR